MQLGMIGLGRMGANMVRRLINGGHQCVVFDLGADAVSNLSGDGATGAASLDDFVKSCRSRAPSGDGPGGGRGCDDRRTAASCEPGDILIDGGNSYYIDDIRRAKELAAKGIHYVDVGTSGGVWGLERGYCLMIGGETRHRQASRSHFQDAGARRGRHLSARRAARKRPARPKKAICTAAPPARAIS